ncbi:MAG TPA: flavin reductase [Planctomycetota bacterium]
MNRQPIDIDTFNAPIFSLFDKEWLLLTAGKLKSKQFNTMTVSWGFLGVLWSKPVAVAFVRPQRYTYKFMEESPDFTLSAFPSQYHDALTLLGTKSGRNGDKVAESGLTTVASAQVVSPCFAEAKLVIECRKIYRDDLKPEFFLDPTITENYPTKDYHRFYLGEVVAISGAPEYRTA